MEEIQESGYYNHEKNMLEYDFQSLIKGMEDIQNYALDQHEMHLDSGLQLRNLEEKIERTSQDVKKVKAKNLEDEGVLHSLQCQSSELKQMIARETALSLSAEEKKDAVQRIILTEKSNYLNNMTEFEKMMAKFSDTFRNAKVLYGEEKMAEEALIDAQELEALKAKDITVVADILEENESLKELTETMDLKSLEVLVGEIETQLQNRKQAVEELEKIVAEAKESMSKLQAEEQQLSATLGTSS